MTRLLNWYRRTLYEDRHAIIALAVQLLVIVGFVTLCVLLACQGGCSVLPATARQTADIAQRIDAVTAVVVAAPRQVVNQLWPIVVLVGAVLLVSLGVPALAAVYLIRCWIRKHAYSVEKPRYEAAKQKVFPS